MNFMYINNVGRGSKNVCACRHETRERKGRKTVTHFEAVKMRFAADVMSLIDASVFISAKASHVRLHKRMRPPRHVDNRMSEWIVMPETQPLCELLSDCLSSLFRRFHLLKASY